MIYRILIGMLYVCMSWGLHNSHNIDTQIYQEDYFNFGCKFSYEGLCLFEYERDC